MKKRIDLLLVEKNHVETRAKAQAMIMAGQVFVAGKKVKKSSEVFVSNSSISIVSLNPQWVSRGALKLIHAIEYFNLQIKNLICLEIGASTGGFTEVLLKNKAKKIYAVDVGTNQIHESLKKEEKIISLEKTNARYLNKKIIPDMIDLIVCDLSFISLKKVLKTSLDFLDKKNGIIIALIKPQFEANKCEIKRGGVVIDPIIHQRICKEIETWFVKDCKMKVQGIIKSPIKGPKGNIEFLILVRF